MRVAVTDARDRHVHGEHQCSRFRRFGAGQHVAHEAAITDHVELKPDRRARGLRDLFDRADRHRRQGERNTGAASGLRRLHFAASRAHAGDADRPEDQWQSLARSKQSRAQVDARDIAQHALFEGHLLQVAHVSRERRLAVRAAVEVVEEKSRQPAPRGAAKIIAGRKDHEVTGMGASARSRPASPQFLPARAGNRDRHPSNSAATSAALLIPGMTETTAGCASGNCSAAAATGTRCRLQIV